MTVQEAHKEYNSLTDHIRAKYKQLDSGEYGSVDTPAFKAEACELANLLAHVSQLCQKLNLPPPKGIIQAHDLQTLKMLLDQNYTRQAVCFRVWRMQLCLLICKNYWVAEYPLSFKNWVLAVPLACNHPCSLTSPRKLTKLPPQTDW